MRGEANMPIVGDFVSGLAKKTLLHVGSPQSPKLLVIHYSVTNTVADAVAALNARRLSYHVLIEKSGTAFQTRPFTQTALHPGLSNWKATSGVDFGASVMKGSIGICLMNMGFDIAGVPAASRGNGKLIYNADDPTMQRWEKFSAAQIATCRSIAKDIIATYPIQEVVGHHDVAIMGKFDPGPLFDLAALDALVTTPKPLGFATTVAADDGFLNLRAGASSGAAVLQRLPNGTPIHIRSIAYGSKSQSIDPTTTSRARYLTPWASVDINGSNKHAGFVHMSGLAATPLASALAARL
jgi:N-acetylmuramoyl-L-alanine amidase